MKPLLRVFPALLVLGFLALRAQNPETPPPLVLGGFTNQGSVTAGYRFTNVNGYRPKFQELFDLESGFRLLDFSLFGSAPKPSGAFADDYSLTVTGLGGDPYSTAQLTARKLNLYDLRVSYRQSRYYWNRNDSAALPSGLHGLTSNHDWATVRRLGSANLLLHATKQLRFSFEYYRTSRDGISFTTRSLDYFGSPATWGAFARANPYYVAAPMNEVANRVTGGVDYTRENWNLHYRLGYQTFEDAVRGNNVASPERSINVDDPNTARELVNGVSWSDFRQLKTPVSEVSYNGRVTPKVEVRGAYIFYRYRGPAALDMAFDGSARTATATVAAPYTISLNTRAQVTEPNHVIDQGLTFKPRDWWHILVDYRYSRFTVDSAGEFRTVAGATVTVGESLNEWRLGTHTLDFNLAFFPARSLVVRTGVRLLKSDIVAREDGILDPQRTKRIHTAWPVASVYYQPSKMLTVRADVEEINNGASYTRVTPHTDIGGRFTVKFKPVEKFYVEESAVARNRKLLETGFRSTLRNNSILATYEASSRFSFFGGFSYDSFLATGFVNFLRGTAPFTDLTLRDQTVDRLWQAGFRAQPLPRLGFSFAGNYLRTTGQGEIAGELPLYGPMKFPYATGTVHYDFPRLGRLLVQLQRTYYAEQIVPANNFGAHLLTICWTRNF